MWLERLKSAERLEEEHPEAQTFHRMCMDRPCSSGDPRHPPLVSCDDGQRYVLSSSQKGRRVARSQVVGRLAHLIGAPVPEVRLVNLSEGFLADIPELDGMEAGLAHGIRYVPDLETSARIRHLDAGENRARFARLAVLFGWLRAFDGCLGFLYEKDPPYHVWTDSFGGYFRGASARTAQFGPWKEVAFHSVVSFCGLSSELMREANEGLQLATDRRIAEALARTRAVARPRAALARYIATRRDALLKRYGLATEDTRRSA